MDKSVVLINQTTGYLMVDIVNAYVKHYDSVVLIAGTIDEYDRKLSLKVKIEPIIAYSKKTIIRRIFTWGVATIQIFFLLLFKYRNALVVYVTNPPISYFPSLILKNKFVLIEYDIYPDALKTINLSSDNLVYKVWGKINKKVFKKAKCIFTLSNGMQLLLRQYVDESKIRVIPNWASLSGLIPINPNDNFFLKTNNIENKFVIMYSGNIGYTHNVEVILELAKKLILVKDIHFVIIGDGGKKQQLVKYADEYNLINCSFLDWQPANKIRYSLSAADLSIVTLTEDTAFVSVPSKTYNILSVGSPLLCIAPKKSEIGVLIEYERCGKCYEVNEIEEMVDYILRLKEDVSYRDELSKNAFSAATKYTSDNANLYVVI